MDKINYQYFPATGGDFPGNYFSYWFAVTVRGLTSEQYWNQVLYGLFF